VKPELIFYANKKRKQNPLLLCVDILSLFFVGLFSLSMAAPENNAYQQIHLAFSQLMQKFNMNTSNYLHSADEAMGPAEEEDHLALYIMVKDHWLVCEYNDAPRMDTNEVAWRMGLTSDVADVYRYRDGVEEHSGYDAIAKACDKMQEILQWVYWKLGDIKSQEYYYYDGQEERSISSPDQGRGELGNIRVVKDMLRTTFISAQQMLYYNLHGALASHVGRFEDNSTEEHHILNHYHVLSQREGKRSMTALQDILQLVQRTFMEQHLKVLDKFVMEQKRVGVLAPVLRDGEFLCEVCGQPESAHPRPPDPPGDHAFKVRTENRSAAGVTISTNSYKKLETLYGKCIHNSELQHFITAICQTHGSSGRFWKLLTMGAGQVGKQAEQHFMANRSDNFVEYLKPSTFAYSFRNGMLVLYDDEHPKPMFYPYVCTACEHPPCACLADRFPKHIVAKKYFDTYYRMGNVLELFAEHHAATEETILSKYRHLKGDEHFKKLFTDQGISEEVYIWILALIYGRPFFPVGSMDNWQVAVHVMGEAQSGKSLCANVLKYLFGIGEVAIINNTGQEKFIIGELVNEKDEKKIKVIICTEASNALAINRTQFCAMTAGDPMNVTVKGKSSIALEGWLSQLVLFGNGEIFQGKDEGGSILRRMVKISFPTGIPHHKLDGLLQERIMEELPMIMTKAMALYLDISKKYGKKSFWSVCPQYFRDEQKKSRMETNLLLKFLNDLPGSLIVHPDAYMDKRHLFDMFRDQTPRDKAYQYQDKIVETARMLDIRLEVRKILMKDPENNFMSENSNDWLVGIGKRANFTSLRDLPEEEDEVPQTPPPMSMADMKAALAPLQSQATALGYKLVLVPADEQQSQQQPYYNDAYNDDPYGY
jgi:hypothetical protein